ncbi:MAG: SusC/RagA family TonB-linked outer membrane protein [Gemmatimonadaceae bacterium]
MRVPLSRRLLAGSAVAAFAALFTGPLSAQQGLITGRVTSERGDPLGGANVSIANSDLRATASAAGTYSITIPESEARGQTEVLTARFIGYKPATRTITLRSGSQEVNFQLERDPFRLEEVIVTGTAEATSLRKTTFTVGRVTEEQLQEVPGASALVAIQGKVAGVRLVPTSSQPGGEPALRLRGATSIGGRQDPLFIVDGVITQFGLADIAPEDVERVEVIKGAAASSLYGSNAANGVVQVFTKRGSSLADGALKVSARMEIGSNAMPKKMEFSRAHAWHLDNVGGTCVAKGLAQDDPATPEDESEAWTVDPNGGYCLSEAGGRIIKPDQIANNLYRTYLNHWDQVVEGGAYATQYVSVGQRRGPTNFNASVQNTRNEGVIFGLGGYTRQNYRLNLDQRMRSNVDASWSAFFGKSSNGRTEEGQGGPFFGLMFLQPDVNILAANPDGTPYRAEVPLSGDVANDFNPLYELANRKINQNRNRFSGSSRIRWRINDWLSTEGSFGYDQEGQDFSDIRPFGFLTSSGTKTEGSLFRETRANSQYNAGVTLTSIRTFGQVTNTTRVGATLEDQKNSRLNTNAATLKVARVPEFGAADQSSLSAGSRDERIKNQNYLAVTTFDIMDRYIVDALVRRDASSLFGPESREATYYRLSGAWRVTEDFTIPGVDELRFRTSYGTAGLRPQFDDQYEILAVTAGGFTKTTLGNPLLKPAQSGELEVGSNIEFGGGRYAFEYTYAKKTTTDQILLVDLPAVAGFKQQWQNTGALESTTHEATLGIRVIDNAKTSLSFNILGDRTRQFISEWTLPERLYSFQQMPSAFFLGANSNLGVLYGNRWIRNIEELYDDPDKAAQSGPGETWDRDNVMINEDGYVVRKDTYGTLDEKAIKYTFCKRSDATGCVETSQITQIGDANPDFNMSFGTNFKYSRFVVNALLDWSKGQDIYNGTRQWAFQATRDRVQDQSGKGANVATCGTAILPAGSCPQKPLAYYAVGFYNGLDPNDYFVERGSYAKLKELSLHYTFVTDQLRRVGLGRVPSLRVGLVGRNLFTITDYSGLDPEISGLFGDPFQVRMDWFQYPQFRTFSAIAEITF